MASPKSAVKKSGKKESALRKNSMFNSKQKDKENQMPKALAESIPSKKPIRFNSMGDELPPSLKKTDSQLPLVDRESKNTKRFNHPFLTYLTLANLLTGSFMLVIACCLQIYQSSFSNMLFWGIDALIVTSLSIFLTGWDLWTFTNLKRDEQHS
jgi:hypothetical protein